MDRSPYKLYVAGVYLKTFATRDAAVEYAVSRGYEEFEIRDRSDAA
jgi:hypothetical protein